MAILGMHQVNYYELFPLTCYRAYSGLHLDDRRCKHMRLFNSGSATSTLHHTRRMHKALTALATPGHGPQNHLRNVMIEVRPKKGL